MDTHVHTSYSWWRKEISGGLCPLVTNDVFKTSWERNTIKKLLDREKSGIPDETYFLRNFMISFFIWTFFLETNLA